MKFFRDTLHLWILLLLIVGGGAGAWFARGALMPPTYGEKGAYRAAALQEIAALPSKFPADQTCHQCHRKVEQERAECKHKAVRCAHCHGLGIEHITEARKLASTGEKPQPAAKWDGDFLTKLDLYITRDKQTCLVCHEAVVGMPKDFRKINSVAHLEEMGASEPKSPETCFECHGGHDTSPK